MDRRSHVRRRRGRLRRRGCICSTIASSAPSRSPCSSAASSASRASLSASSSGNAGGKSPLDHQLALEVRVRRAHRPAVDRLEERLRVDAERLGQRDRLRQPLGERQQPGVEDELEAAAGARPRRATASSRRSRRTAGCTRSRTSSGPEASTTSLPCSAGCLVPSTGASTNGRRRPSPAPRRARSRRARSCSAGPARRRPSRPAPRRPRPRRRSRRPASSSTTSAPRTASAM